MRKLGIATMVLLAAGFWSVRLLEWLEERATKITVRKIADHDRHLAFSYRAGVR